MSVRLPAVAEKTVYLHLPLEDDPAQELYVKVRHATNAEEEAVAELFADNETVQLDESGAPQTVTRRFNLAELRRKQVFLTLSGCNIVVADESDPDNKDKDKPLFTFVKQGRKTVYAGSEDDFKTAYNELPEDWATAIIEAVYEANEQWKPRNRSQGE